MGTVRGSYEASGYQLRKMLSLSVDFLNETVNLSEFDNLKQLNYTKVLVIIILITTPPQDLDLDQESSIYGITSAGHKALPPYV